MYLVDTNVWLELLLEQEKADEARQFIRDVDGTLLAITEFSLYSIGVAMVRLKKDEAFRDFLSDTMEDSAVIRVRLDIADLRRVLGAIQRFDLDFDDAYQYVAAARHNYTLVSFDKDFDRTDRGRKSPGEVRPA